MAVEISSALLDRILAEAAASPSREVCGLLFGGDGRIAKAKAAVNVAADPSCFFEIDPAAVLAAHRAAREGGPRPIGCYHSHPNGPAAPSLQDAASVAPTPGFVWLILAGSEARLFREAPGGSIYGAFDPVELVATRA